MMEPHGILVGKTYRAADGELRRVMAVDGEDVIYKSVIASPGAIARHDDVRMSLHEFAQEAEGELPGSP